MANNGEPAPDLKIPPSQQVVDVFVINSTADIRVPLGYFVKNPIQGNELLECPSLVFLVQHHSGKKALFDLGVRKDTEAFPPATKQRIAGIYMNAERDVAEILQVDGGVPLHDIDSIIWSHWHTDHIGNPATFPYNTELVVGPCFKDAFLPGYPANPFGLILESDYEGRQIREIEFSGGFEIGGFRAMDFFGDGSFYLLEAPGHAAGHMCALARTTPSTFIFMGADGCHHGGSLRPNKHVPLPNPLSPSPFTTPPHLHGTFCPGSLLKSIHPKNSRTEPYYSQLAETEGRDVYEAERTIHKMISFDANENVFVMCAHDKSLMDVVDFFPYTANRWKEKGWKEASRWRFLEDFKEAAARKYLNF